MFNITDFHNKLVYIAKSFGGRVYLVGGAVRDEILGIAPKDLDYVITKVYLSQLQVILKATFPEAKVNEVGESFGIIKLTIGEDEFDFAIPRFDFDRTRVIVDPFTPIHKDLLRRDTTMNSLAKDLETGEIISPEGFDGIKDIKDKVIRATGDPLERFQEDPLRILRCISQAARFKFEIECSTYVAMRDLRSTLHSVSSERFYDEFKKGWTKGHADIDIFFRYLEFTNIGEEIFGKDFKPLPCRIDGNVEEMFLCQYMAAFYMGGDYKMLSKKVHDQQWIEAIRCVKDLAYDRIPLIDASKKLSKHFEKFEMILTVLQRIDHPVFIKFQKVLEKPFIQKVSNNSNTYELPVSGEEIINCYKENGIILVGKDIQSAIFGLITAYQFGHITGINKEAVHSYIKENHNGKR